MASTGRDVGIQVDGFEEYVGRYGKAGWIKGLEDERPLEESISNPIQRRMGSTNYRVKDIFYYYFIQLYSPTVIPPDPTFTSMAQRDRMIDLAEDEVRRW
jgi:hypothetical protein